MPLKGHSQPVLFIFSFGVLEFLFWVIGGGVFTIYIVDKYIFGRNQQEFFSWAKISLKNTFVPVFTSSFLISLSFLCFIIPAYFISVRYAYVLMASLFESVEYPLMRSKKLVQALDPVKWPVRVVVSINILFFLMSDESFYLKSHLFAAKIVFDIVCHSLTVLMSIMVIFYYFNTRKKERANEV